MVQPLGTPDGSSAAGHHFLVGQIPHGGVIHEQEVLRDQELQQLGLVFVQSQAPGHRGHHLASVAGMAPSGALPKVVEQGGQIKHGGIVQSLRHERQFGFGLAVFAQEDALQFSESPEMVFLERVEMEGIMLDQPVAGGKFGNE